MKSPSTVGVWVSIHGADGDSGLPWPWVHRVPAVK